MSRTRCASSRGRCAASGARELHSITDTPPDPRGAFRPRTIPSPTIITWTTEEAYDYRRASRARADGTVAWKAYVFRRLGQRARRLNAGVSVPVAAGGVAPRHCAH